ncbi:MAG: helicase, partial [Leptospiraceae bacterium]|nr:helicase [Leptospiraceae bacterium]
LLGAHLAGDKKVLPDFAYVIIDEAHNFPEIINKSFSVSSSWSEIETLLNSIFLNEKKPMLVGKISNPKLSNALKELTKKAVGCGIHFFNTLVSEVGLIYQPTRITKNMKLDGGEFATILEELKEQLTKFKLELPEDPEDIENKETHLEVDRIITKLEIHRKVIESFQKRTDLKQVYWIEPENSNTTSLYKMNIQPIESKQIFQEKFFSNLKSVIFTSATLCTQKNDFEYFKESLGTKKFETIFLESPFPYERNALLYLPKQNSLRDPNEDSEGYLEDLVIIIPKLLELTEGKAFVLFTSNKLLNDTYISIVDQVSYPIFSQIEMGAEQAKEKFLNTRNSVLFGVSTFWQGIDIKGDKLRSVIITKLPFQPPSDPVLEALIDEYKKQNRNPFFELQLPRAILTLKQGFGRLIRSNTD